MPESDARSVCTVKSQGEIKSREVEQGSHSRTDCPAAELFLNSCFSDTVFVPLLCTAVETAISEVHKSLHTGGVPTDLLNIVVLVAADGLSGLCRSERLDELFLSTRPDPPSHPPPFSPSLLSRRVSVDVKHHERGSYGPIK